MKLTSTEHENLTNLIHSKLNDLNIFSFFKFDKELFEDRKNEIEKKDLNSNHSHYLNIYNKYVSYIETDLNDFLKKLNKLLEIVDECSEKEVSDSFVALLKSVTNRLDSRDEKALSNTLNRYNDLRTNYNIDTYWVALELLGKDIPTQLSRFGQFLNSIFIFNYIKSIFNNIVLIGANGSGKSRFSREIAHSKTSSSPISIIPAQHLLCYEEFNSMANNNFSKIIQDYDAQDKIGFSHFDSIKNDFTNLIKFLQADYNKCARKEIKDNCIFKKVSEIFQELIKTRKVIFNDDLNMPMASTLNGKEYSINEMSDGEKAILYFIVHVINAKQNSFIVVDEPENHLHYDACISLWNRLEKERSDCVFLYLSHNIDFVLSRTDATLIWNKNFSYPDQWDIEAIDNTNLPKKVYLEILGTVPPILFCEGESDSLDKEIYSALFPEFLIKECGGCEIVKQYKISINNLKLEKNKNIYAVVDKDLKSSAEIAKCYVKYGIKVLKVLEVENLFFVPELASILFNTKFNDFKEKYFELSKKRKNIMINERLKDLLVHKLNNIKTKSFLDKYTSQKDLRLTLNNVRAEKKVIEKEFDKILDDNDYAKALEYFDLKKGLFDLADRFISDYKNKTLNYLRQNRDLCRSIAKKYIGIDI